MMENNEIYENESFENDMSMEDVKMNESKGAKIERGFNTALKIVTAICNAIVAIGGAMESAQKISTARDNMATARNMAQTQRIKSEVNKTKALNHQRRVESRLNRKG